MMICELGPARLDLAFLTDSFFALVQVAFFLVMVVAVVLRSAEDERGGTERQRCNDETGRDDEC